MPGFDFVDFDTTPDAAGTVGDRGSAHGTHVASLVAQVAPGGHIIPIRVLVAQGVGNPWVLTGALLHSVDADGNPATDDGAKVINLSRGTTRSSDLLEDIIEDITCDDVDEEDDDDDDSDVRCDGSGGAVVVDAVGNSGDTTRHYPAAEEEDGALADFSTRSDRVHVAAPGERVYGAIPGGA